LEKEITGVVKNVHENAGKLDKVYPIGNVRTSLLLVILAESRF